MDDRMFVPMPTEEEKDRAINAILDAGLSRPVGMWRQLGATARSLPLSALFFGVGDCLFLAAVLSSLCLVPTVLVAAQQGPLAPLLFLLSPVLYGVLQVLTLWKDGMSGTLEWKQTCRISCRVMTALRMLCFGGASVLVCVPVNVLLWILSGRELSLLWMLSLSFSSLFLYAALALMTQSLGRLGSLLAAPLIWLAVGVVLLAWEKGTALLLQVPAWIFFLLAAGGLAVFLAGLDRHISMRKEGGVWYAVR